MYILFGLDVVVSAIVDKFIKSTIYSTFSHTQANILSPDTQ